MGPWLIRGAACPGGLCYPRVPHRHQLAFATGRCNAAEQALPHGTRAHHDHRGNMVTQGAMGIDKFKEVVGGNGLCDFTSVDDLAAIYFDFWAFSF